MIAEQVTVTTTPTSIQSLIATARSTTAGNIPVKSAGIMLKYASSETATVTLTDVTEGNKPGSANGVVVLDAAGESLLSTTYSQISIDKAYLNCSTGTVAVDIIVLQARK